MLLTKRFSVNRKPKPHDFVPFSFDNGIVKTGPETQVASSFIVCIPQMVYKSKSENGSI